VDAGELEGDVDPDRPAQHDPTVEPGGVHGRLEVGDVIGDGDVGGVRHGHRDVPVNLPTRSTEPEY